MTTEDNYNSDQYSDYEKSTLNLEKQEE